MIPSPASSCARVRRALAFLAAAAFLSLLVLSCATSKNLVQGTQATVQSADGSRIAYGVVGHDQPAVMFVHGWLGDHAVWQHQIEYFSNNHRVIWLDLAGHGASTADREQFTMTAFAQDVAAVVDATGARDVILVGHSMGGPVVIEAAKLLGDKVIGIVGVDAFYTPLAAVPEEMKLKFIEMLKTNYPAALQGTVDSMFTESASRELQDMTYDDMLADNHDMGVSALRECILWNSRKEPQELRNFEDMLYNINAAPTGNEARLHESVVLIPGVGHFLFLVKPDEFNAALESIIEKIRADGTG